MKVSQRGDCIITCGLIRSDYGLPEIRFEIAVAGLPKVTGLFEHPAQVRAQIQDIIAPYLLADANGPRVSTLGNLLAAAADHWPPTESESKTIGRVLYNLWTLPGAH